jgi:Arf-GAP with SH3 domain, ANK repeat and PH domain-containing protein
LNTTGSLLTDKFVDTQRPSSGPKSPNLRVENSGSYRLRVPSNQSIESRISDSDGGEVIKDNQPQSPGVETIPEDGAFIEPTISGTTAATVKVDVNCQRPGDDVTAVEDGPLFRATMKAMELKTGNMRARWKKVLKRAENAHESQLACNAAIAGLMEALREAAVSNAHAVQPAMEHYFDKIAKEILANDRRNANQLQKMIIDPISKLYNLDIKQADAKKRDFDEESKEYYAFVGRYLGQRQDSLKEKKRIETDSKYQARRRNFELKRFDYSSYLQDLHGGRKDQEVLSNLTRYADAQAKGFLDTGRKIESLLPQLEALNDEVREADKEFQLHRTEREEKRRALEKGAASFQEPEAGYQGPALTQTTGGIQANGQAITDTPKSVTSMLGRSASQSIPITSHTGGSLASTGGTGQTSILSSSPSNKFRGIRDLEERDHSQALGVDNSGSPQRKEGLVWALSRPGSHVDPRGLNKQAWHK